LKTVFNPNALLSVMQGLQRISILLRVEDEMFGSISRLTNSIFQSCNVAEISPKIKQLASSCNKALNCFNSVLQQAIVFTLSWRTAEIFAGVAVISDWLTPFVYTPTFSKSSAGSHALQNQITDHLN